MASGLGLWALRLALAPHPAAATDPIERLSASDAFAAGLRLGGAGRHLASLPYFRRAVRQAPDSWTARENFASTLYNGAQEARSHLGKDEPATRSSVERMEMIEESFRQTDTAATLTGDPHDQALIVYQQGQAFHTFGLVIDGLVEFRKAAAFDPSSATLTRAVSGAEARLRAGGLAP